MNETLASDKIGGCRYTITIKGDQLVCVMKGYGLKAQEVQPLTKGRKDHFSFDAAALRDRMVRLERRMRDLARLQTSLTAENNLSGVARPPQASSVSRPSRGVNPFEKALKAV